MSFSRLVAAVVLFGSAARAAHTNVQVVNGPANPVPVQVQSGTVSVQNTSTGPLAVSVEPAAPVTVTPLIDQTSISLFGICTAVNHPTTQFVDCNFNKQLTIPAGYQFVIDNIGYRQTNVPVGVQVLAELGYGVQSSAGSGTVFFPMTLNATGSGPGLLNYAGSMIGLHVTVSQFSVDTWFSDSLPSDLVESSINMGLTGHFVPIVPQLQPPHQ
jgi:hypothetical protein